MSLGVRYEQSNMVRKGPHLFPEIIHFDAGFDIFTANLRSYSAEIETENGISGSRKVILHYSADEENFGRNE